MLSEVRCYWGCDYVPENKLVYHQLCIFKHFIWYFNVSLLGKLIKLTLCPGKKIIYFWSLQWSWNALKFYFSCYLIKIYILNCKNLVYKISVLTNWLEMYRVIGIVKLLLCVYTTKYDENKAMFKENIKWLRSGVQNRNFEDTSSWTLIFLNGKPLRKAKFSWSTAIYWTNFL